MKNTKWVVYALLLSFFVVLSPRELWHDCDEHHKVHVNNEVHLEQKDCFACEFDLGIISVPYLHFFSFEKQIFLKFDITRIPFFHVKEFDSFLLRGPPII